MKFGDRWAGEDGRIGLRQLRGPDCTKFKWRGCYYEMPKQDKNYAEIIIHDYGSELNVYSAEYLNGFNHPPVMGRLFCVIKL